MNYKSLTVAATLLLAAGWASAQSLPKRPTRPTVIQTCQAPGTTVQASTTCASRAAAA
jgi:hypothetical protein